MDIQNIQSIQNMNYGNLIYDKIIIWICWVSSFCFSNVWEFWKCNFVFVACFALQAVIFNMCIGFVVVFCIYEYILKIFVWDFGKISHKCEQFSYEGFFGIFEDFLS